MDPDAALQELRDLVVESDHPHSTLGTQHMIERFAVLFDGLDQWLSKGGHLPRGWESEGT